jgi:hypothetical protein
MIQGKHASLKTLIGFLIVALALIASAGASQALAQGPHWQVIVRPAPTNLIPGEVGVITIVAVNLGDAPVSTPVGSPVVVTDALPPGLEAVGPMEGGGADGSERTAAGCEVLPALRCTFSGLIPPFVDLGYTIHVRATHAGVLGENKVTVEGGGVPSRSSTDRLSAGGETPFGIERYELTPEEEDGSRDLRAGSHPFQLTTTLEFNQTFTPFFSNKSVIAPSVPALLKNLYTTLPAGLVANANVIPQCAEVDFLTIRPGQSNKCPPDTALGVAVVSYREPVQAGSHTEAVPVFNLPPQPGEPARLGFEFATVPVTLDTSIKTGNGYAAEVKVTSASQAAEVLGTVLTIWGVPGDPRHDESRGWECLANGKWVRGLEPRPACTPLAQSQPPPYLTQATTPCDRPLSTSVQAQSWEAGAPLLPPVEPTNPLTLEGCSSLPFDPALAVRPDHSEASTPSGLNVEITMPQQTTLSAGGLAEADIGDTSVTLPEGMLTNAGSADGLGICSTGATTGAGLLTSDGQSEAADGDTGGTLESELAGQRFTADAVSCPEASKVGTVNIKTPLLEHELKGNLYFGTQDTNPFAAPLVLYLVAEDPVSGVRVKLVGEIKLDRTDGRIESVFHNAPPVPFETLKLHLYDGGRATQTTPSHCGSHETNATFLPSATGQPAAQRSASFNTIPNADGQPCPGSGALPFAPGFQAGSLSSQAGGFSPFTLTVARPDGDAALKTISMKLPPGLAATLASVTPCPEPQAAQGTCSSESKIGHSTSLSGLGNDPVVLPGDVYLTGPYDGAPFGLSSVTEATAGPFHLGRIVVRSSISVDENTAAATIDTAASQFYPLASEAGEQTSFAGLPELLKGTPAQVKQLNVTIDRGDFQFNPTNCEPQTITGTLTGYEGTSRSVSTPYQATNCAALPFAPKLTASVSGQASKANGATFAVTIESAGIGQASIHKVNLTLPAKLPSRLTTIQKACLEAVFNANPAGCPEGSVIGEGIVHTPVLKSVLRGPAYLVSHGSAAFPDIEFVLQGEGIKLVLDGKTDIKKGVTYSRFETAPDAPFTKFESIFPAGPHSALTAHVAENEHYNLCKTTLTAPIEMTAQSGAFISQTTKVKVLGCAAVKGFKVTRTQQLARALKACRKKFAHAKSKRAACEKKARKKFGSHAKKRAPKKSAAKKR